MHSHLAIRQRETLVGKLLEELPDEISEEEVLAHSSLMPLHYWKDVEFDGLVEHIKIIHTFFEQLHTDSFQGLVPVTEWKHDLGKKHSDLLICTWDRHGLFEKITGALAVVGLHVSHAQVLTRHDHIVMDTFRVYTSAEGHVSSSKTRSKFLEVLTQALKSREGLPFSDMIQRKQIKKTKSDPRLPSVMIDTRSEKDVTLLSVRAVDYRGLLFDIVQALSDMGFLIVEASIQTEKGKAIDEFCLCDSHHHKVTDAVRLNDVRKLIEDRITQTW